MEWISKHKQILSIILAFLAGIFWIVSLRFVTYKSSAVHYHANFAVFVDGERIDFSGPLYYEEVQACGGENVDNPKIRVHMHDQKNHVVHVHDQGATWGHFFANIGLTNGDIVFRNGSDVYVEKKAGDQIRFLLNGEEVETTANRTIQSEDVLLVSIGNADNKELQNQYDQISRDAGEYNNKYDPSSCSGGKELTFAERLKHAFGFFDE